MEQEPCMNLIDKRVFNKFDSFYVNCSFVDKSDTQLNRNVGMLTK